jgi:hypothetical protein
MQYLLYACDNMVGLEGLPIILQDLPIYRKTGLGSNVTGQLAAVVVFDDQSALACL